MYMSIPVSLYLSLYIHVYIYIYIYREREREIITQIPPRLPTPRPSLCDCSGADPARGGGEGTRRRKARRARLQQVISLTTCFATCAFMLF